MRRILTTIAFMVVLLSASSVQAVTITFEDLYSGSETADLIPVGYAGFSWSGSTTFGYVTKGFRPGSGYDSETSGYVSIYSGHEIPVTVADSVFDFNSATVGSAWKNGQHVDVQGWLAGIMTYSAIVLTNSFGGPDLFTFNFIGVDEIRFVPLGDGLNAGYGDSGNHIVIDDITYNASAVPDPSSTLLLLGSGVLGLLGIRRRLIG